MTPYYEHGGITIYHGDCREVLPQIAAVDLVVTSPPYAEQRLYGQPDFNWNDVVPPALSVVNLVPDGQMLVNLGLVHRDGEVVCYWEPLREAMRTVGYRLFGWYVWDQGSALPGDWNGRFAPSHEFLFHFNREAKQPRKFVPTKGGKQHGPNMKRRDGTASAKTHDGKLYQPFKIPDSVIRLPRDQSHGIEHPARFPIELPSYVLAAFGGCVLDPFMGSGTTLHAAKELGRKAIGIEIEERYCEIAAKRLAQEVLPLETISVGLGTSP